MKILNHSSKLFFAILFLMPFVLTAQQSTEENLDTASAKIKADSINRSYFTNTILINQFGEEMKFYDDLLKGKIVVINAFFSECSGACPIVHDRIQKIQEHLGDRLGTDVNLISITVDPDHDKPEVLKSHAEEYGAKQGWYFLSGNKENVETVLKKLGKYVLNREAHDNIILMGNLPTGLWKKVIGISDAEEIIKSLTSVINDQD